MVDQLRSWKIPIYTNLHNRLTNVGSTLEAEVIIEGVLRSNVLAIFPNS